MAPKQLQYPEKCKGNGHKLTSNGLPLGKMKLEARVAKLVALEWPLLIALAASMELAMPIADPP